MTLLELCPSLRAAARPRFDHQLWPATLHCDEDGRPSIGEVSLVDLADQFGTPCDLVDELQVRSRAQAYLSAMSQSPTSWAMSQSPTSWALPGGEVAYSGRALLTPAIATWLAEEGLSVDISSREELEIALRANFPAHRLIAGSAVKTREELEAYVCAGVGRISVDTLGELSWLASSVTHQQRILLRVGLPARRGQGQDELDYQQDFGFPIGPDAAGAGSLAEQAWRRAAGHRKLRVVGLHCHVGSGAHEAALVGLLAFLRGMRERHGLVAEQINLGGGISVETAAALARTLDSVSVADRLDSVSVADRLDSVSVADRLDSVSVADRLGSTSAQPPRLVVEPGQGLVGQAGIRLVRVIATSPGTNGEPRAHVDGALPIGCGDARASAAADDGAVRIINRHSLAADVPTRLLSRACLPVGRGAEDHAPVDAVIAMLPQDLRSGDLLAFPSVGAYHHALGSSAPLVGVRDGKAELIA